MNASSHNPHACGFTSIEVLAATVLAASLMVAVLGVLAGIAKQERLLEREVSRPVWQHVAFRQIAHDLRQASSFRSEPDRLILTCYALNNSGRQGASWSEAEIHYFSVEDNHRKYLARQVWPKHLQGEFERAELVCEGVDLLTLHPETSNISQASTALDSKPLASGLVPPRLRVELSFSGTPLASRDLVLY